MTEEIFIKGLKILQACKFPGNHDFTFGESKTWEHLLSDIPDDDFIRAVGEIAKTSKFFPAIAEIRARALRQDVMLAEDAWVRVQGEMDRVCGTRERPRFPSPIIELVVDSLGGLNTIWMGGSENASYFRHQFIKSYNTISAKEAENAQLGLPTREEAAKLLDKLGLNGIVGDVGDGEPF